jgi:Fe-S cluster biogenesis protein NfuA
MPNAAPNSVAPKDNAAPKDADFQKRMRKVEALIEEIEASADPQLRSRTADLTALLMEMHGVGLKRMVELLRQDDAVGGGVVERLAREPLVASLLLLHGLHPVELATRVAQALDQVRPLLRSHGGDVELLAIEEGVVRLRLVGSCHGCPSSTQTLKNSIEEAIYGLAPDVVELHVEGAVPTSAPPSAKPGPTGFVPVELLV